MTTLHPMHPAAWVVREVARAGWEVYRLLTFTRASTILLVSRDSEPPVVMKAGFGSNHVLAELDDDVRAAAYGFYWYQEMTAQDRALTRDDFRFEIDITRAASGARHVVPVLESGGTDRFDWYTMPHCPDGNFRSTLMAATAGGLDPAGYAKGLSVLADIATGLVELHERGIVHRDVYHENILVSHGYGLVTDLGAARYVSTPRGPHARGPEVHWPPEYGTSYDTATPAADVFSLAALAYRFTCADLPRLYGMPHLDAVAPQLREALAAGLAHQPGPRPSMTELRDALREASVPEAAVPSRRP